MSNDNVNQTINQILPSHHILSQAMSGSNAPTTLAQDQGHPGTLDPPLTLSKEAATAFAGLQSPTVDGHSQEASATWGNSGGLPPPAANRLTPVPEDEVPVPTVTAQKRLLIDKASHKLLNTKNPRPDETSNAPPLQLEEKTGSYNLRPRIEIRSHDKRRTTLKSVRSTGSIPNQPLRSTQNVAGPAPSGEGDTEPEDNGGVRTEMTGSKRAKAVTQASASTAPTFPPVFQPNPLSQTSGLPLSRTHASHQHQQSTPMFAFGAQPRPSDNDVVMSGGPPTEHSLLPNTHGHASPPGSQHAYQNGHAAPNSGLPYQPLLPQYATGMPYANGMPPYMNYGHPMYGYPNVPPQHFPSQNMQPIYGPVGPVFHGGPQQPDQQQRTAHSTFSLPHNSQPIYPPFVLPPQQSHPQQPTQQSQRQQNPQRPTQKPQPQQNPMFNFQGLTPAAGQQIAPPLAKSNSRKIARKPSTQSIRRQSSAQLPPTPGTLVATPVPAYPPAPPPTTSSQEPVAPPASTTSSIPMRQVPQPSPSSTSIPAATTGQAGNDGNMHMELDHDVERPHVPSDTGKGRADGLPSGTFAPPADMSAYTRVQLSLLDEMNRQNEELRMRNETLMTRAEQMEERLGNMVKSQFQDIKADLHGPSARPRPSATEDRRRNKRSAKKQKKEHLKKTAKKAERRVGNTFRRGGGGGGDDSGDDDGDDADDGDDEEDNGPWDGESQDAAQLNDFAWCIREKLSSLIDRKSWRQIARKFLPLTAEQIEAFEDDLPTAPVCTADDFLLCFYNSWTKCSFNRHARFVFIQAFLASVQDGQYKGRHIPKKYLTQEGVGRAIDAHMVYAREQWRLYQRESWQALRAKQLKEKSASSRKATLYVSRLKVIELRPKLQGFLRHMAMMDPNHMSGDETAGGKKTHPPTWSIVESAWMSEELRTFLHWLDELYREDWAHPSGRRRTPGNPPRVRVAVAHQPNRTAVAPRGMPRNFYDNQWFAKLKPHQAFELMYDDEHYDLTIPVDIDVVEQEDEDEEL